MPHSFWDKYCECLTIKINSVDLNQIIDWLRFSISTIKLLHFLVLCTVLVCFVSRQILLLLYLYFLRRFKALTINNSAVFPAESWTFRIQHYQSHKNRLHLKDSYASLIHSQFPSKCVRINTRGINLYTLPLQGYKWDVCIFVIWMGLSYCLRSRAAVPPTNTNGIKLYF